MNIVHFETLGCKLNQIETESLARAFSDAGFSVSLSHENAATLYSPLNTVILSVVNTCTVTGKAEQKARRLIRLLLRKHPESAVLVTGCYAEVEADTLSLIDPRVCVFPGSRKGELADLPQWLNMRQLLHPEESVLSALNNFMSRSEASTESTFRLSTDDFLIHSRASIKIQDGCNNHCSYCRIRLARGKAVSLDSDEVVKRVLAIEKAGWGEVVLTGVNLSQYRTNLGDFVHLLAALLEKTHSIAVRISSLYPERIDGELLPLLAHPRVRPHFHLSVQSGSDRILSSMRRPYTSQTVYEAAAGLRRVKENPFLACDIITGYPGETEEDFQQTLTLCREIGFAWIHAFPFSARPGTEAFTLKPKIPERIAGERVAELTALAKENNKKYTEYWIGRKLSAIAENTHTDGLVSVLTENYIPCQLEGEALRRGQSVKIVLESNGRARMSPPELP